MQNNENIHIFECPDCKIQVTVALAPSYVGQVKLTCCRCKRAMQKVQTPVTPIENITPVTAQNFSTSGLSATTDNLRILDARKESALPPTSPSAVSDGLQELFGITEDKTPKKVSHYTILKRIGKGGMGEIFLAEDDNSHAQVAIKLLSSEMQKNETAKKRFLQEAKVHSLLEHDNIVRIYEVGYCINSQRLYLAMEYVDGGNLENVLEQKKVLSPRDSIRIGIAIGHALEYAFSRKIIHRDLKPANILIDHKSRRIKLGDFGLGKLLEGEGGLTGAHVMMGTVYYMPPEQIENASHADNRADIYALGATLYHMITGRPPYSEIKGNHAVVNAKIKRDPIPIQEYIKTVSPTLAHLIHKALSRDKAQRYSTPTEMVQDLKKALQEQK